MFDEFFHNFQQEIDHLKKEQYTMGANLAALQTQVTTLQTSFSALQTAVNNYIATGVADDAALPAVTTAISNVQTGMDALAASLAPPSA
jgi:uncharacterized protein YlxW (UPF0749 family)